MISQHFLCSRATLSAGLKIIQADFCTKYGSLYKFNSNTSAFFNPKQDNNMPMQNTLTLPVNHTIPVQNEFKSSFTASEQDKLNFLIEELLEAGKEKSCMELLRHLASADSAEEEACCRELLTLLMAQK
ncbi:hypothetical protein BY447_0208 [Pantoea sp. JKS000250]|nr:hypothetical protein BY447_0208 [Pantoea sp. JKS000250]